MITIDGQSHDCNDLNENSTIVAFDADCDGLTSDDCNDNDGKNQQQ